jgi:DNA helicase-2/ATP-dependent DNA helicase PcrA
MENNRGRLGKELRAERRGGKKPVLAFLPDQDTEAEFCAELIGKGGPVSDWAILYRTNAQSLGFETEFIKRRIPYRVVGSLKFYEREEVKDTMALLAFLVNPRDEVAFRRVVNKPSRGIGLVTVERIVEEAQGGNLALSAQKLSQGLSQERLPQLSAKARFGISVFLKAIEKGRDALNSSSSGDQKEAAGGLRAGVGLSACVVSLAVESGIAEYHLSHDEISGNQRLYNLQELANHASTYQASEEGLLEFLENIELDRSIADSVGETSAGETEAVTLITLHNTKGLEFRRVIITGVEQGIFPRGDKEGKDLEEERRLFYVGATRAMDELYLTSCARRRMYGRTVPMKHSLFLEEIESDGLRVIGSPPSGFGRSAGFDEGPIGLSPGLQFGLSSDGRWATGDRVYHGDHGYGAVTQIQEGEEGPVIKVIFETGFEKRFLSLHQSHNFTKIENEY